VSYSNYFNTLPEIMTDAVLETHDLAFVVIEVHVVPYMFDVSMFFRFVSSFLLSISLRQYI